MLYTTHTPSLCLSFLITKVGIPAHSSHLIVLLGGNLWFSEQGPAVGMLAIINALPVRVEQILYVDPIFFLLFLDFPIGGN